MRATMTGLLLLALFAAPPAGAAEPVSPSAFRDWAEGHTLHFERAGEAFGSEAFREGGAVTWRFPDGSCVDGLWRPHSGQLCFVYEGMPEVQCWRVLRDGDGFFARLLGDGPDAGMELRIARRDSRPLLCGAPGLGL